MFIAGVIIGILLGMTVAISIFLMCLLRVQGQTAHPRRVSVDRYA
jgi:hypothetical protein